MCLASANGAYRAGRMTYDNRFQIGLQLANEWDRFIDIMNLTTLPNLRSEIHRIVSAILPLDLIEQTHIDFALGWIASGTDLWRREKPALPPIHLVSYFVLVSAEKQRILLVDHKKAELWLPTGGHVEPGEHPKATVVREAHEELGIEPEFLLQEPLFLTVTTIVGSVAEHIDVSLWYLLKGDINGFFVYDTDEFHTVRWFGIEEIPFKKSDPHMGRFIKKMRGVQPSCPL